MKTTEDGFGSTSSSAPRGVGRMVDKTDEVRRYRERYSSKLKDFSLNLRFLYFVSRNERWRGGKTLRMFTF